MKQVLLHRSAWIFSCLIIFVFSMNANEEAEDLDFILQKVMEANGGNDAIESIKSYRIHGSLVGEEDDCAFSIIKKRPGMVKVRINCSGKIMERGYSDNTGWTSFQHQGRSNYQKLKGQALEEILSESDFDGPLIGEPIQNQERRYLGRERLDRVNCYIVEVTNPVQVTRYYLDPRTFTEKQAKITKYPGTENEYSVTLEFENYFKLGPFWIAGTVRRKDENGELLETVQIEDAEINPGVFRMVFNYPGDADSAGKSRQ